MVRRRFYSLLALAALALPTCSAQEEGAAVPSPLALWNPASVDAVNDATLGSGTVSISEPCVIFVSDNGKSILLVWPEPTAWKASTRTVEFVGVFGEMLELQDGDRIMPGGANATPTSQFVTPPDDGCEVDETFIVSSVVPVPDP
ncbi:hypothetical protein BH24DEI2_BH24DEI2_00520 [soil metagenome]